MSAAASVSTAKAKGAARSRRPGAAAGAGAAGAVKPAAVSAFYAAGPALSLGGLAQAKLKVGQAHDPYEREADRVADQVTSGATVRRMPVTPLTPGALTPPARQDEEKQPATLQRQTEAEEEPKQTPEEEQPAPTVQRQTEAEEEPKQTPEEEQPAPTVQRQAEAEEEPAQESAAEPSEAPVAGGEPAPGEGEAAPESTEAPASNSEPAPGEGEAAPESTEAPASGGKSASAESEEAPERTEEPASPEGTEQEESTAQPMRAPEEERETPTIQRQAEEPEQPEEQPAKLSGEQEQPTAEEASGPEKGEEEETPVQKMRAPEEEREAPPVQRRAEQRESAEQKPSYGCEECREKAAQQRPVQRQPEEAADAEPVQAKANPKADDGPITTDAVTAAIDGRPVGSPLSPAIQRSLEPTLGVNLTGVRVHTDSQAETAAAALKAKAFTHRHHIWLGRGQSPHDLRLMAHELTHVAQQGGARAAAPAPGPAPGRGLAVAAGPAVGAPIASAAIAPAPPSAAPSVQREESLWDRARNLGGSVVTGIRTGARAVGRAIGGVIEGAATMGRDALLALIRRLAPGFAQLIEQGGVVNFLRGLISGAFQSLFGGILGRIRGVVAFQNIFGAFTRAAGMFRALAAQLAANDCSGILQIAGQVGAFMSATFGPVFRRIGQIARSVAGVFSSVLRVVGAPVVDFLRRLGGAVWAGIQSFARTIGALLSSVRSAVGSAWTRVRSWFGLPEDTGADEGGGVWNWIKNKARGVWDWAKGIIRPLLGPLRTVGQVLLVLSPVGPVIAAVAAWPHLRRAFAWLQQTWRNLNLIPRASAFLSNTVFPALTGALNSVGGALQRAGAWVVGAVQRGANALLSLLQAAGGQALLAPLAQAVSFVSTRFGQLAAAVGAGVSAAVGGAVSLFHSAVRYLQPVWEVLRRLIAIAVNPFGITGLLMGSLWRALPECLKGPIIDFIISILIGLVRVMPSSPVLGLLWPFVRSALLGFLERLQSLQLERKVNASNKMATIIAGGSVTFAFGYLKGLALGVWEAIIGPFLAIRDLFRLPELIRNFVSYIGEHFSDLIAEARQMLATLGERVESSVESLIDAAGDLLRNPGRILDLISNAVGAALGAVGGLGASLANQLIALFEGPDAMIGETLGKITGSFVVQAVLSYFTAGAAGAAGLISRVAGVLARVGGRIVSVLRNVISYFPRILSFIRRIADLFARARSAVSGMLQRIVAFFRRIGDRLRSMVRRAGRRIKRAVGGIRRRFRRGPRNQGERTGSPAARALALRLARGVTAINDVRNTPVSVLIGELMLFKLRFPWIQRFEARPKGIPNHYSIHLIASDHSVDEDYTPVAVRGAPDQPKTLRQLAEEAGVRSEIEEGRFTVSAHGTTESFASEIARTRGEALSPTGGNFKGSFFTAHDLQVADEFAGRTVSRLGGSPGVVGIAVPEEMMAQLRRLKLIKTLPIGDRPGYQTVFMPGALEFLQRDGFFFIIKHAPR